MSSSLLRSSRDFNLMFICHLQAWDYCADLGKWWDWAAVSGKKSRWAQVKSQIKTLKQVELHDLYVSSHTVKRTEAYQRKKSRIALGGWFWELVKWACCAVRHSHEVFLLTPVFSLQRVTIQFGTEPWPWHLRSRTAWLSGCSAGWGWGRGRNPAWDVALVTAGPWWQ